MLVCIYVYIYVYSLHSHSDAYSRAQELYKYNQLFQPADAAVYAWTETIVILVRRRGASAAHARVSLRCCELWMSRLRMTVSPLLLSSLLSSTRPPSSSSWAPWYRSALASPASAGRCSGTGTRKAPRGRGGRTARSRMATRRRSRRTPHTQWCV